MEQFRTFRASELNVEIIKLNSAINKAAESAAHLHVTTIKTNNAFHFAHTISELNKAIIILKKLLPEGDGYHKYLLLLEGKTLIKDAENFFKTDIY